MSEPSASRHERDEARRREALATLDELRGKPKAAGSGVARALRQAADHFAGRDAIALDGSYDVAELWGRRIGRTLSFLFLTGLVIYLALSYLR